MINQANKQELTGCEVSSLGSQQFASPSYQLKNERAGVVRVKAMVQKLI